MRIMLNNDRKYARVKNVNAYKDKQRELMLKRQIKATERWNEIMEMSDGDFIKYVKAYIWNDAGDDEHA